VLEQGIDNVRAVLGNEPYRVYAATKNAGKLRELQEIFALFGWELSSYADYADVEESADTYGGNAALKARTLRAQLLASGIAAPVLGDDSGLEVAALSGRPGVYSARYGGTELGWPARRALLVSEIAASGSPDRSARFVCALHLIYADGSEIAVERDVRGLIGVIERGSGGFGYDSLFEYPPLGRTFGELSDAEKHAVSHRGAAARALVAMLGSSSSA
jgi:XTP/dITP diphosphohydrolase